MVCDAQSSFLIIDLIQQYGLHGSQLCALEQLIKGNSLDKNSKIC